MPPGPSSPARMPSPRKTNSRGAPKRAETTPAKMLSSTSTLPSKISWWLASTASRASRFAWHRRSALRPVGRRPSGFSSQFHGQDHHRHVSQVQPTQHGKRRFTVKLTNVPIIPFEDELAGKEDTVRKFPEDLLDEVC